jgi:hypothetical protein
MMTKTRQTHGVTQLTIEIIDAFPIHSVGTHRAGYASLERGHRMDVGNVSVGQETVAQKVIDEWIRGVHSNELPVRRYCSQLLLQRLILLLRRRTGLRPASFLLLKNVHHPLPELIRCFL